MSQNKFLSVFIEKKETLIESTDWGTYKIYFKCQFLTREGSVGVYKVIKNIYI